MHKGWSRIKVRQARYGWIVWAPLVAFLFGMMAWDASLNIRLRRTDYEFHKAETERRATVRRLDEKLALEAQMKSMEWLTAQAEALGLRAPALEQVEVVRMDTLLELPLLLDAPEVLPPLAPPAPAAPDAAPDSGGGRGALLAAAPGLSGPVPQTATAPAAAAAAPPPAAAEATPLDKSLDALISPL
ncbi:MAG TPA: hypothetical protein P5141_01350 [Candidatus Hydrogenedentes bacterium]|nr:hypothetical protein [Candidatus Hydrogenedentota bacterium]HRZ16182.1 hypothetical protein [Candidatus Hydrogenedentota bacterium]HRZ80905.1 hypothetical protein [Candidatus Hydrogenedentota bacterium]